MSRLALVAAFALALAGCPEPPPEPAPDGGGTIIARDGGGFLPDPPDEDAGAPPLCPADDEFEDDDARADANPLDGEAEAVLCGGDDDYWSASATVGCLVSARVAFDPSTGDVDLQLFDPDGTLVDASTGTGAEKTVAVSAAQDGDYSVRVRGDASVATRYALRLVVTCEADLVCPADDGYEDNDEPIAAVSLAAGELAAGIVCTGDDDDYFALAAPVGCAVDAQLTYPHEAGRDLDLRVVLADASEAQRSLGVDGTERTVTLVEPGSAPVVRINGFGASFTDNTYRLTLDRICAADLDCPAGDYAEPNDDGGDAFAVYPGAGALGVLCAGDEDWYRVRTTVGCTYETILDFDHEAGNLELQVLKSDDTVLGAGLSQDDDEAVSLVADSTLLRLRVFALSSDIENTFRLSVRETCP